MIYSWNLHTAGLVVGIFLILIHAVALIDAVRVKAFLKAFPRSKMAGAVLLSLGAAWAFWLALTIDLGDFTSYRRMILVVIVIGYFLTLKFVDEFLAVRALGILALLAAEPVLEAAFLRPEVSRLLLAALAYVWVTLGIFWVAIPYILRDQIDWVLKSEIRWKLAVFSGLAYGAVVLYCTFAFYAR
jgi:hypothetical protein